MKYLKILLLSIIMITKISTASTEVLNTEKSFDGLSWVWSDSIPKRNFNKDFRFFRNKFTLPDNSKIKDAFVVFTADDKCKIFVNGKLAGENVKWKKLAKHSIKSMVTPGENVVAIEAYNKRKHAGIIGKIVVELENAKNIVIPIDQTWKVSKFKKASWKEIKFNDKNWKNAKVVGKYGCEPWGIILSASNNNFPEFSVPGYAKEMKALRNLFKRHYRGQGLLAAIWDKWLPKSMLWPALSDSESKNVRKKFKSDFLSVRIADDGYVATRQHRGLGHPDGWPFPHWGQNAGIGWHFSLEGSPASHWGFKTVENVKDWKLHGIKSINLDDKKGWKIKLAKNNAELESPKFKISALVSPLVRLEWEPSKILENLRPYVQWKTTKNNEYNNERKSYFNDFKKALKRGEITFSIADISKAKGYDVNDTITQYKISFENKNKTEIIVVGISAAVDTRHNINNSVFASATCDYFWWTDDLDFLEKNINRMRKAMRYAIDEFQIMSNKCVFTPWIGHDGRSGLVLENGKKTIRHGVGIGNNYWDLMPFGGYDALATIYFYDAAINMAKLEKEIAKNPDWKIQDNEDKINYKKLFCLAKEIKKEAGKKFWNEKTGRFVAAIDVDGVMHDYGYTFLNCEAIYYGFANKEQTKSIMDWVSGERIVSNDTSKGKDIYHWRMAPRATTKRNIDYYTYAWSAPEIIPFGGQIQDGGAVLGFSFHDLMSRLKIYGADNAWQRLQEILKWDEEVQSEGGYRKYYENNPKRGTLQGGGTAGGLGMDCEFFESVLLPQIMIYGFLGFSPSSDGFEILPNLPKDWQILGISNIRFHDQILDITANSKKINIQTKGPETDDFVFLASGKWKAIYFDKDGKKMGTKSVVVTKKNQGVPLRKNKSIRVEIISTSSL